MTRITATLFLLLTCALGVQAQKGGAWASARERSLKGAVQMVVSSCSDINGQYETRFKYEFARDGKLDSITAPQFPRYDCIIAFPTSYKITKRNSRGDVAEADLFIVGELERKERFEYEYDAAGNWIKMVTFVMREYEIEGGSWKAGDWQAKYICHRAIEYYPASAAG